MLKKFFFTFLAIFNLLSTQAQHLELTNNLEPDKCSFNNSRIAYREDGCYYEVYSGIDFINPNKKGNLIAAQKGSNEFKLKKHKVRGKVKFWRIAVSGNDLNVLMSITDKKKQIHFFKVKLNEKLNIISEESVSIPNETVNINIVGFLMNQESNNYLLFLKKENCQVQIIEVDENINVSQLALLDKEIITNTTCKLYENTALLKNHIIIVPTEEDFKIIDAKTGIINDIDRSSIEINKSAIFRSTLNEYGNIAIYGIQNEENNPMLFYRELSVNGEILNKTTGESEPKLAMRYTELINATSNAKMTIKSTYGFGSLLYQIKEIHYFSEKEFVFQIKLYNIQYFQSTRYKLEEAAVLCHVNGKEMDYYIEPYYCQTYYNPLDDSGRTDMVSFYDDETKRVAWIVYDIKENYTEKGEYRPVSDAIGALTGQKSKTIVLSFDLNEKKCRRSFMIVKSSLAEFDPEKVGYASFQCEQSQPIMDCSQYGFTSNNRRDVVGLFHFD